MRVSLTLSCVESPKAESSSPKDQIAMASSLLLRATAPARRLFHAARPTRGEACAAARRRIVVSVPPPAASAPPSPRRSSARRPAPDRIDRVESSRPASFSTSTSARASGGEAMAGGTEAPRVVEDCRGVLQVLSDGTTVRSAAAPYTVEDRDDGRVEWRDAVYHAAHGLGVRMYRPARREGKGKARLRLPVLAYFHGGGFCIGSRAWSSVHACCLRFAHELPAVLLSFDYRLAPEHRLPAAHQDAAAALAWLRDRLAPGPADGSGSDEDVRAWLADSGADPGRLFVSGDSAGANIAHHMAARFGAAGLDPVKTAGYVLVMPAFTSEAPTQSELGSRGSAFLSRDVAERYNRLALPAGANKDYPLMNPLGPDSPGLGPVGGRVLVVVGGDDMLKDNQVRYVDGMKAAGNDVELAVFAGKEHGFFSRGPWSETSGEVVRVVGRFMGRDAADSTGADGQD
ncbi:probable carboxylesterase 15 isoform X2 [Triticum urartu]|uniref:probable carboxylesterase 15 isoform X2 n=1 Tax=Triticum urartu TaxID=4572 RepID=UPI0020445E9D|nr:probable carboxylesterase 15 isoform X2 [Triticum urartu]